MSRSELHALVRDLRQYLQWQSVPHGGVVPASDEEVVAAQRSRAQMAEAKLRRAMAPPTPAAPEPREEAPRPADRPAVQAPVAKVEPPASAAAPATAALWKNDSFGAAPRPVFAQPSAPNQKAEVPAETDPAKRLEMLREYIGDCTRCGLCEHRQNIVFGVGNPHARLMFVGEGPGRDEDLQGEPFVGKAGQLLDKMIGAMGLKRDDVYICNVVKCRPPNNRDPEPQEVARCAPFLRKQIEMVNPEVIVALGKFASNTLTRNDGALGKIRGRWHTFGEIDLMPTYHPAYLLRNEGGKRAAWEDLQKVMKKLGLERR